MLICLFTGSSAVIFFLVFFNNYLYSREMIEDSVKSDAVNLASSAIYRVEAVLSSVQKVTETLSSFLENNTYSEAELQQILRNALEKNPELYGAAIAFEPYAFSRGRQYFAPYFFRKNGKVEYLMLESDKYRYFYKDWYQIPKELRRPQWSEPYFDEGGGNILMATYSVPFYRIVHGERRFMGVVTADISLEWLSEIVSSVKVLKTGYGALLSKNGTIITHPVKQMIMNESIFSIAEARGDNRVREIGRSMIKGETKFVSYLNVFGMESMMYYAPVPSNGWVLSVVFPTAELFEDVNRLGRRVVFLSVSGIALLSLVIVLIANSITRPLRAMTKAAEAVGKGQLNTDLPRVKSGDEVGRLTSAFQNMQRSLKTYICDLTETTAARERIENELKIAHDIQMSILPKFFPAFPDRKEFDIYAFIESAKEVGGDFYDFFFIDEVHFCFIIADVSGKGIPASLYMAVTKTLIKATAIRDVDPARILFLVNNELCKDNDSNMFVSIFCGILNTESGTVLYSNGGHNPPIFTSSGASSFLGGPTGLVMGAMYDFNYKTERLVMLPGDNLFLYTDGVTEAMNSRDELFSEGRLLSHLEQLQGNSDMEIIGGLMEKIVFFSEGFPQSDDITMMMITFNGDSNKT